MKELDCGKMTLELYMIRNGLFTQNYGKIDSDTYGIINLYLIHNLCKKI